ncbi:glycerophosphodiester phosphodiesterase [Agromyces protaetiae]|uniref:Glycerophosphodiester phosphodiesterase n=1 Tax=Agromyces protaetiae TaxID=2509455 RepID=A0A4V0YHA6_9MICO|nr:glycerophosphodiester phosphodiesterase family protein [Agromyces protaetiae]QAY74041.1 glycerophosphodiester phosphodiesterase [Agromyces protaetiae]
MASAWFDPTGPRVLAHRGLAVDAPENTLPAFAAAQAAGARYIETDVHLTRDGIAVVAHDETLDRVAGRAGALAELTMAELRTVDLGDGIGFVPLDEALDAFPEIRFNIDVKASHAVEATVSAVRRTGSSERVLLTSFSDSRRRRIARSLPDAVTSVGQAGVVRALAATAIGSRSGMRRALAGAGAFQVPERVGPQRVASPRFVALAHSVGAEVHVWTVNDPADMRRLLDLGVDGIVTDRCDLALTVVRERSGE